MEITQLYGKTSMKKQLNKPIASSEWMVSTSISIMRLLKIRILKNPLPSLSYFSYIREI